MSWNERPLHYTLYNYAVKIWGEGEEDSQLGSCSPFINCLLLPVWKIGSPRPSFHFLSNPHIFILFFCMQKRGLVKFDFLSMERIRQAFSLLPYNYRDRKTPTFCPGERNIFEIQWIFRLLANWLNFLGNHFQLNKLIVPFSIVSCLPFLPFILLSLSLLFIRQQRRGEIPYRLGSCLF